MMVENVHSKIMFEPSFNFHFGLSRLLESRLIQYSSSEEIYLHQAGSPGEQKRVSSGRVALLKPYNGTMLHTEKKYPDSGLHVDFTKIRQTA